MKNLLFSFLSSVAVLGASAGLAVAQSSMSLPSGSTPGQRQNGANPSQLTVFAPSDIAASSSGVPDERRPHARQARMLSIYSGTGRTSAQGPPNLPRLCFQPGIGWTTATAAGFIQNNVPNDKASNEDKTGSEQGLEVRHGVSALSRPGGSTQCPPMLLPPGATNESGRDKSSEDSIDKFADPLTVPGAELGQYDSFQTFLSDHPVSATGNSKPAFDLPQGLKGSSIHGLSDPDSSLEELRALRGRAYLSQVKIRRLSRDPNNIETRLELRRMNSEVEKRDKSKRSREDQKTIAAIGNANGNKHLTSRDLLAKKAECDKNRNASKSKVCSLLKQVM